ncbi:juvenile hormone epoxide hydrolase-like [Leguminivora glycinivorella]|uniref:juvenile hormone epoxide hydrolase-like n=1 Tax=Leguminivora glycinivorella TaxID=1035111 RepID=UPI00200DBE66|nr:juvenile hormone epoxide hydrolase-like [Leguminivora glycinivorella]
MEGNKRKKAKKKEEKLTHSSKKRNIKDIEAGKKLNCCAITLTVISIIAAAIAYHVYTAVFHTPELPAVDLDVWWGPNHTKHSRDTSIRPFRIVFSDAMQEQLVRKFDHHRRLEQQKSFNDTAWTYGVHSSAQEQIFSFWQYKYKPKERERFFNKFDHFKTNVQGLDLHFMRVRPETENIKVLPIMLLHGWPSSFREFYEVAPLLTTQRPGYDFVFEVIVPSLPGFGFSQGAVRPGLGPFQMAIVMRNLMNRLGFTKYYIHGGDFGHVIGSIMATLFPNEVLGFHSSMPMTLSKPAELGRLLGAIWPTFVDAEHWQKMYPLKEKLEFLIEETGYSHLQATKPDTIGIALNESPLGLATYILDKIMIYTDPENKFLKDGGLSKYYNGSMIDLIDNVMVYWVSESITTSMRIYKELSRVELTLEQIPTSVPTWFLCLKNEMFYNPEFLLRWKYPNLIGTTTHNFGGHFAALEKPQELADDIFLAVKIFKKIKFEM